MSLKLGSLDVAEEIIELHFQLRRTQRLLEIAMSKMPTIGGALSPEDLKNADNYAFDFVQKKFPDLGIKRK